MNVLVGVLFGTPVHFEPRSSSLTIKTSVSAIIIHCNTFGELSPGLTMQPEFNGPSVLVGLPEKASQRNTRLQSASHGLLTQPRGRLSLTLTPWTLLVVKMGWF